MRAERGVKLDDKDSVLASVLLDLSQGASMSASVDAAELVMQELYKIGNITNRGVKHASYFVIRKTTRNPAVLVECGFVSNSAERAKMMSGAFRARIAEGIAQGIVAYKRAR